jgi:4-alpha-glucanotransferase
MSARCAGILIPLFSLRSPDDFGRGEIGGLAEFGEFALAMGQRVIQLLPIDEVPPGESSPYSAMSVLAIDPAYIAAQDLPELDQETLAAARAEVRREPFDLARLRRVKDELLSVAFRHFKSEEDGKRRAAFNAFVSANRGWLDDYALFHALKEKFGGAEWARWPKGLSRHNPRAVAQARRALSDRVEVFKFVQFEAQRQWLAVRAQLADQGVLLGGDLAFSPARESVEVWARQELFDLSRSVGAPPDAFSANGQRWDLPMPDWARMRVSGFALIRQRVRAARERFDYLRIDHLVGLFRTYGYPLGADTAGAFDPSSEAAQRAQGEEILRVILKEAGPMRIIVEDLGVIPPFVRETLRRLGLPGYKIARWERDWSAPAQPFISPAKYPVASLVTTGTHDTDTLAEWWESIGAEERRAFLLGLGINDPPAATNKAHLGDRTLERILEALYASPAEFAIIPIQDLFGWKERINVPGTVGAGNWTWRLPFDPARALEDPKLRARIAKIRELAVRTGRFVLPD